jgi:hypothetical protein
MRLFHLGVHLGSAAVRLVSVEYVLREANLGTPEDKACSAYFGNGKSPAINLATVQDKWLHFLLRHSAAHEETTKKRGAVIEKRIQDRNDLLGRLSFSYAYATLLGIRNDLRSEVNRHCSPALPI